MDRLYNKNLKLAYIKNYDGTEQSKETIFYLLVKSANIEKQYDKDIYGFNYDEIESLLHYLKRDNVMSLHKDVSILKDYVYWCIKEGQRGIYENGENRFAVFQSTEDLNKYISKRKLKHKYLTKQELDDVIDYLVNPVDRAIVLSLYEFIGGEKLHELRVLKIEDVEKAKQNDNIIELRGIDGSVRHSKVSDKLIHILEEANEKKEYILGNGFSDHIEEHPLADTEYIIRLLKRKKSMNEPISYGSFINKINTIKKYTGYDFITASSLKDVRIIHEIADISRENPSAEKDEIYRAALKNISEQYDVNLGESQSYNIRRKYEQLVRLKDFT